MSVTKISRVVIASAASVVAVVAVVACGGAGEGLAVAPTSRVSTGSPSAVAVSAFPTIPFDGSECTIRMQVTRLLLSVTEDPMSRFAAVTGEASIRLGKGPSSTAFAEVRNGEGLVRGIVQVDQLALDAPRAFDGWALVQESKYLGTSKPVRETRPSNGGFELVIRMPPGIERVDESTEVRDCYGIGAGLPGAETLPRAEDEKRVVLDGARIPLSRTPGGPPVAHVTPKDLGPCNREAFRVATRNGEDLVRLEVGGLVVYGFVPSRSVRDARPRTIDPICAESFLPEVSPAEPPPGRLVRCDRAMPIVAESNGTARLVAELARPTCLRVLGRRDPALDAVTLDGRAGISLASAPDVAWYAPHGAVAECKTVTPGPRGDRPSLSCD